MMYEGTEENPRFPHSLRVLRARLDEYGVPVTDDEGNPVMDVVLKEVRFGTRDNSRNTTTSGEVVKADKKIACPRIEIEIKTGDTLELTESTRSYRGTVVKAEIWNPAFGTNIWFDEVKN